MLARGHLLERAGLHALEPDGTGERGGEDEDEESEQEPDAPIRDAGGHFARGVRST
jgi:hypothetical protein